MLGTAVDVAIGLTFVYWVLSLFCAVINEWVASLLGLRSRTLKRGINQLLDPTEKNSKASAFANLFHSHPLIKQLCPGSNHHYPSYIPTQSFTLALMQLAVSDAKPAAGGVQLVPAAQAIGPDGKPVDVPKPTQGALTSLLAGVEGDVALAQQRIAKWFDDSMEQVSGWYKRRAQLVTVIVATVVAVALNINTSSIARSLWRDPTARAALVAQAQHASSTGANTSDTTWLHEIHTLDKAMPLGWSSECPPPVIGTRAGSCESSPALFIGLALSVIALSLGAPFWFDTMNKFINLRATGTPPDEQNKKQASVTASTPKP